MLYKIVCFDKKKDEIRPSKGGMKKTKFYLPICLLLMAPNWLLAQAESPDFFRSIGKIYVVVAVIAAIFIGIVIFLIYLERRISKLENQNQDEQ